MPTRKIDRLHSENPARLVGQVDMARLIVAVPPADMRDSLCPLEPGFTLAQAADHDEAAQRVGEPMTDLLEQALLVSRPRTRARALVQTEQVGPVAFRIERHRDLRADCKALGSRGGQLALAVRAEAQRAAGCARGREQRGRFSIEW